MRDLCYDLIAVTNKSINCDGCMTEIAQGHAHIIPQARCKVIGKTELIWNTDNIFLSCHKCNSAIENPKGQEWKKLKNIDKCLKFIAQHDPELFVKFKLNAVIKQQQPTGEIKGLSEMFSRLATEPTI